MLDPGTILAVTSLVIQSLEILLKSVCTAEEKSRAIAESEERLYEWSAQLHFCDVQIDSWFNVWGGFSEQEYRSFWGDSTYQNIKQWLPQIRSTVLDIEKYVKGLDPVDGDDQGPSKLEWQSWRDLDVKAFKEARRKKVKIKWLSKIAFSLVHDARLKERFERLERSLLRLNSVSRIKFRSLRAADENQQVERRELSNARYAETNITAVTSLATAIYEASRSSGTANEQWHIELRKPDPYGDAQKIDLMAKLHLDLSIQTFHMDEWKHGIRIRVPCTQKTSKSANLTVKGVLDELASLGIGNTACSTSSSGKGSKVHQLQQPSQLSLPLRALTSNGVLSQENTLQAWSTDQVGLLRGYAHWVLLLWNTEWTHKLCCCCIRFQNITGHGRQYTLACAYHTDCPSLHPPSRRLVSFGVTVTEILSATPLRVTSWSAATQSAPRQSGSGPLYSLEAWDLQTKNWQAIAREEVLQLVLEHSSERVAHAVAQCLDPDLLVDDSSSGFLSFYHHHILAP